MKQLLRYVSNPSIDSSMAVAGAIGRAAARTSLFDTPICWRCQTRGFSQNVSRINTTTRPRIQFMQLAPEFKRQWSASRRSGQEERPPPPPTPRQTSHPEPEIPPPQPVPTIPKVKDDAPFVHQVPDEELPSYKERQRWDLSKRFGKFMEQALATFAVYSHKVNTVTGTDYSGIEALRQEIKDQEALVKRRLEQVQEAKQDHEAAVAQQNSSHREVVTLLERKHSWSATDLERYMSLVRSEHLNDQSVAAAKDNVRAAEKALEEARTRLEKRERDQYHEEQIWSDTIRRNSTWVTIGLMGFNMFLLLLSILVFEPFRRRKIVREVKKALDENKASVPQQAAALTAVETQIDAVTEPTGVALETLEQKPVQEAPKAQPVEEPSPKDAVVEQVTPAPIAEEHVPHIPAVHHEDDFEPLKADEAKEAMEPDYLETPEFVSPSPKSYGDRISNLWAACLSHVAEPFSNDEIELRKVDLTAVALASAAFGGVFVAGVIAFLRGA